MKTGWWIEQQLSRLSHGDIIRDNPTLVIVGGVQRLDWV